MATSLTFVLGGARSGKSGFSQKLAITRGGDAVLFVATLRETETVRRDREMQMRVARHQASRPQAWPTLVLDDDVGKIDDTIRAHRVQNVLLDCLSLYISGVVFMQPELPDSPEDAAARATNTLLAAMRATEAAWIVVSNEAGMGIVPDNAWGRAYRDALGRANQIMAAAADEVYFVVAGLPMKVK
jgi:adenosyl cobinamide kinase/adenosyl cobinamide phosphate guanylyltransferase